jgi:Protein of unknown function (DUF3304)
MLLLMLCLAACTGDLNAQTEAAEKPKPADTNVPRKSFMLSIVGYNYTDRYIDSFEVNGRGGGNLGLSSATAGGGKTACCVSWTEGSKLPLKVTVKWVASYCIRRETNSAGETNDWREPIWNVTDVEFDGPVPDNPRNFEVHIYKEGSIAVVMSEKRSPPQIILPYPPDGYVRPGVKLQDPKCPADYDRVRAYDNPTRIAAAARSQK